MWIIFFLLFSYSTIIHHDLIIFIAFALNKFVIKLGFVLTLKNTPNYEMTFSTTTTAFNFLLVLALSWNIDQLNICSFLPAHFWHLLWGWYWVEISKYYRIILFLEPKNVFQKPKKTKIRRDKSYEQWTCIFLNILVDK